MLQFIAKRLLFLFGRARHRNADREGDRDQQDEAQFSFHANISRLCGQLLEHRLIHPNAGLEIFQWKVFVR